MLACLSATLLVWCLGDRAAQAQIGFRQLQSVHPVAVQRGTKAAVRVRSNFTLDGAYAVFFDRPGIAMTYAETKPIEAKHKGRGTVGTPFRFDVDVPAEQEPRVYEFRVATDQAVSSVSHLLVTDYPVVEEQDAENGEKSGAQVVPIPAAFCGVCEKPEDVDYFRFSGEAGREVTLQIYAQRVTHAIHDMVARNGNYLMDPILTLFGPQGQVLAQNDNFYGGDAFIHARLPETGGYVCEVRDARYLGDPRYVYCVEISDRPCAQAVFPFVVQQGTTAPAEIVGHILDGQDRTAISAAPDEPPGWKNIRIGTPRGETNTVAVLVSEYPEVVAAADNRSLESAQTLSLPTGVSGRFESPEETHFYAFDGVKGRNYLFEVDSHRRGLLLDAVLEILDARGKKLAEADDSAESKDARLEFRAPADGRYVVAVHDLHGRGGPRCLYHLRAEQSAPDFEIGGDYYYAMLGPGMHTIWFASLKRLRGFEGPVEMQVDGLPQGISLTPVTIPPGMSHCALVLSASEDAAIGAGLVRVFGTAQIGGDDGNLRTVTRQSRVTCEVQSQGGGQSRWPIGTQIVGVVKPMDLVKVEASPSELYIAPGGSAELIMRIERSAEFTEPVTLDMGLSYFKDKLGEQLPPEITLGKSSQLRLTGKTLEGKIVLEASRKAQPISRWPVAAVASVSISFSVNTKYASNPVYLTVAEHHEGGENAR